MENTPSDQKTNHSGITKRLRHTSGKNRVVYRAQVRLKGYPNQSKTFDKLSAAVAWKAETETKLRNGFISDSINSDMTFKQAVEDFEEYLKVEEIHSQSRKYINWQKEKSNIRFLYHLDLDKMKVKDIDYHFMSDLMMEIYQSYNLKQNTVNNRINALSRVLNYLIKQRRDIFPSLTNPVPAFRKKVYNARERTLIDEEEKAMSQVDFFVILMETAMRRGELSKLTWSQVSITNKTIKIMGYNAKNNSTRHAYIAPQSVKTVFYKFLFPSSYAAFCSFSWLSMLSL